MRPFAVQKHAPSEDVPAEFCEQAYSDGLTFKEAVESYFNDFSFEVSQLTPLDATVLQFEPIADTCVPYIAIAPADFIDLRKHSSTYFLTPGGQVVTYGDYGQGFALIPLQERKANQVLAMHAKAKEEAA